MNSVVASPLRCAMRFPRWTLAVVLSAPFAPFVSVRAAPLKVDDSVGASEWQAPKANVVESLVGTSQSTGAGGEMGFARRTLSESTSPCEDNAPSGPWRTTFIECDGYSQIAGIGGQYDITQTLDSCAAACRAQSSCTSFEFCEAGSGTACATDGGDPVNR